MPLLLSDVDLWFIDIKDLNENIYRKYTGTGNKQVIENLMKLDAMIPQVINERYTIESAAIEEKKNELLRMVGQYASKKDELDTVIKELEVVGSIVDLKEKQINSRKMLTIWMHIGVIWRTILKILRQNFNIKLWLAV